TTGDGCVTWHFLSFCDELVLDNQILQRGLEHDVDRVLCSHDDGESMQIERSVQNAAPACAARKPRQDPVKLRVGGGRQDLCTCRQIVGVNTGQDVFPRPGRVEGVHHVG